MKGKLGINVKRKNNHMAIQIRVNILMSTGASMGTEKPSVTDARNSQLISMSSNRK